MTDEANIAEAELAKVIAAALGLHSYQRNEAARGNFCIVCTASFAECIAQHSMDRFQTKKITNALLAAGYRKRSDVLEEAAKGMDEKAMAARFYEVNAEGVGAKIAARVVITYERAADFIRSLKDHP